MTVAPTAVIQSAANPQFKRLKKLADSAGTRRASGRSLLDGRHLLDACADAGLPLVLLIVREGSASHPDVAACLQRFVDIPRLNLSPALFDALSPVQTPVGILAEFAIPKTPPEKNQSALLLESIQDPGNLGTILRTAAAAGIEAVYLNTACADAWSPKVLRAAMGAHFLIAVHEDQNLPEIAAAFDRTLATTLQAETSIYDVDLRSRIAFVFGNEGAGLSKEIVSCTTLQAHIPMPGKIESLNVAAAAAICLFERVRQLTRGVKPD